MTAWTPSEEIALRFLSANCGCTGTIEVFLADGHERLAQFAVRFGAQLATLRKQMMVDVLLMGEAVEPHPIALMSQLLADPDNRRFVCKVPSTMATIADYFLVREFGHSYQSGYSIDELLTATFWDHALDCCDIQLLHDNLLKRFVPSSTPQMSSGRLAEMIALGRDLSDAASHIPFGSLAHAIAKKLNICITLSPLASMNGAARHRIVHEPTPDELKGSVEELILYRPSVDGPSALDFATRYAVAHELAHIALEHPARMGLAGDPGTSLYEEIEAHSLAAVFVQIHGAPTGRSEPTRAMLVEILKNTDLPPADRNAIIEAISGGASPSPLENNQVKAYDLGGSDASLVQDILAKYLADEVYRGEVNGLLWG
jgi:hypothetical protein